MATRRTIKIGDRIGRFTILDIVGVSYDWQSKKRTKLKCLCQCDCGSDPKWVFRGSLGKDIFSCGCLNRETKSKRWTGKNNPSYSHGLSDHPLFHTWHGMLDRCYSTKATGFSSYGERGIEVTSDWHKFENFLEWAYSSGWQESLYLERIDNNGNYEPCNCKWENWVGQSNNKRRTRFLTAFGEIKPLGMWARDKRCQVRIDTLGVRVRLGWNPEKAITLPPQKRERK